MARWLWLFLSVFAVAGLLASTPARLFASDMRHAVQTQHDAQHDCCPGMTGAPRGQRQHGPQQDHARLPGCCVVGVCACHIAPSSPLRIGALRPATFSVVHFVALRHDNGRVGQSRPPDLRPPIA
jgi:hypothetical protein